MPLSRPKELPRAKEKLDRCFAGYLDATMGVDETISHCGLLGVSFLLGRGETDILFDSDYMAFPSNHDI